MNPSVSQPPSCAGSRPRAWRGSALVALALIPTLYAGLYLYANHDPYAALSQVPAAVASDDRGATLDGGERLDAGRPSPTRLVDSKSFAWHKVSSAEALAGVYDGTYSFAVVIPESFSADLAPPATSSPARPTSSSRPTTPTTT